MAPVHLNHPTTTGYSICWDLGIISAIHAHTIDEDLAFYTRRTPRWDHAIWAYMPMDPGDSIAEIWKRSGRLDRDLAIMFKTSQGRLCLFGQPHSATFGACTWTLLDRPEAKAVTIWLDEAGYSLAMETPEPPQQSPSLLPEAPSPIPKCPTFQYFIYSSAILSDVAEVATCRPPKKDRVGGLLLRYTDGREACVGEIRFDCLGPPVKVSKLMKIWLEFVGGYYGVFVRTVQFSRPLHRSASHWFEVPMCGLLEWWFSYDQCKVQHGGRASPATIL